MIRRAKHTFSKAAPPWEVGDTAVALAHKETALRRKWPLPTMKWPLAHEIFVSCPRNLDPCPRTRRNGPSFGPCPRRGSGFRYIGEREVSGLGRKEPWGPVGYLILSPWVYGVYGDDMFGLCNPKTYP